MRGDARMVIHDRLLNSLAEPVHDSPQAESEMAHGAAHRADALIADRSDTPRSWWCGRAPRREPRWPGGSIRASVDGSIHAGVITDADRKRHGFKQR